MREMQEELNKKAAEKGYDSAGADGPLSPLATFLAAEFSDHALGEIVCKCVRFKANNDPTDLVKIAAWAFLVYKRWLKS